MDLVSPSTLRTISLPADLADQVEELARREDRPACEILLDALEAYVARKDNQLWKEIAANASQWNPMGYTEDDIPRLIKEVRAEMDAEKRARKAG
jgi:hypothetical protein